MRAVTMQTVGGPEVLVSAEIPEPQIRSPHEVKVRLHAAGINPVDTKLRARGTFYPDVSYPVLGCDGAGVVVETGAEVSRFRVGDEVWFCDGGLGGSQGCYAQYKVLDEHIARRKPASIDFFAAAAAPLVLITAWEALHDRVQLAPGDRILIHAAAGGVGHVAVQLASLAGARVLATVADRAKRRISPPRSAPRPAYCAMSATSSPPPPWNGATEGGRCRIRYRRWRGIQAQRGSGRPLRRSGHAARTAT